MLPVFILDGVILNTDKSPTPSPEVPSTEPVSMDDLFRAAQAEALKASTKKS